MGRPYTLDLRERVVAEIRSGSSRREAAEMFNVSPSSAIRWSALAVKTGSPAALPVGGKRPLLLAAERDWIEARMARQPDVTLRALLGELRDRGLKVSYYAVWHIVRRADLRYKKNPSRQ